MKETQKTIANALAITVVATLFFFALTFIVFDFLKAEASLKDAWATLGSFFGGITTLVAAYVASKLFNDWRETQTAQNRSEHAKAVKKSLIALKSNMDFYRHQVSESSKCATKEEKITCKELKEEFLKKYNSLFIDLQINLDIYENTYNETLIDNIYGPHLKTYFLCIKIAFDEVIDMDSKYTNLEVAKTLSDIEKFNNSFHIKFFLPILNKLNPHINLVD